MITNHVTLPLNWGEQIDIIFFGDSQIGSTGFSKEAWQEFRNFTKSLKRVYFIGLGDYGDFIRPTIAAKLQQAVADDKSAKIELDDLVAHNYKEIIKEMNFMQGRILGLHEGHHDWAYSSGMTATQMVCQSLKARFLGWMGYTTLHFTYKGKKWLPPIQILSMHGTGAARMTTTDGRWLEANIWPSWEADIYARGHSTKLIDFKLIRNFPKMHCEGYYPKTRHLINCGGFCNGYTDGFSSYVEKAGLPPSPLGFGMATLKIKQNGDSKSRMRKDELHAAYVNIESKTIALNQ